MFMENVRKSHFSKYHIYHIYVKLLLSALHQWAPPCPCPGPIGISAQKENMNKYVASPYSTRYETG